MNFRAVRAIYLFEMARTWRTLLQSIVSPVVSTSLYFVVFGAAIGSRITSVEGVSYGTFIVPGLVMLSVLTQSIANASFGIYFPKFVGTIYLSVRNGAHLAHAAAKHRFAGGFDVAVFRGVRCRDRLAHHLGRRRQLRHLHRAGAGDAVGLDPEHRQRLVRDLFSEIRRHDLSICSKWRAPGARCCKASFRRWFRRRCISWCSVPRSARASPRSKASATAPSSCRGW